VSVWNLLRLMLVVGCLARIKMAEKQYMDAFNDELESFKDRIRKRAQAKIEEAMRQVEEVVESNCGVGLHKLAGGGEGVAVFPQTAAFFRHEIMGAQNSNFALKFPQNVRFLAHSFFVFLGENFPTRRGFSDRLKFRGRAIDSLTPCHPRRHWRSLQDIASKRMAVFASSRPMCFITTCALIPLVRS